MCVDAGLYRVGADLQPLGSGWMDDIVALAHYEADRLEEDEAERQRATQFDNTGG